MSPRDSKRSESSLVSVVQTLTEDVIALFREHLRLARVELKQDAALTLRYVAALALFGVIAVLGLGFLSLSAILFAGWAFGLAGMAVVSLLLSVIHLGFGLRASIIIARRLNEDELGPHLTGLELRRSRQWASQQRPTSPPSS